MCIRDRPIYVYASVDVDPGSELFIRGRQVSGYRLRCRRRFKRRRRRNQSASLRHNISNSQLCRRRRCRRSFESSNSRTSGIPVRRSQTGVWLRWRTPTAMPPNGTCIRPPSRGLCTSYSVVSTLPATALAVWAALFGASSAGGSGSSPPAGNIFCHFSKLASIHVDAGQQSELIFD